MKKAIGLLLLGVAAGAAINMMLSPSQKRSMRRKLYRGTEDFIDSLKDKIHQGNERINEYAELAEERIDLLNKKIRAMEKAGA
jgi:gas vesicle protein